MVWKLILFIFFDNFCILFFIGQVNIEIEIGGKILEFSVTPFHAAIIYKFQDKDTWTIGDLSSSLKCSTACIRKRINLWQNCGLLKEEAKDTFRLVEDTSKVASNSSSQAPVSLGVDVDDMNVEHHIEPDKKEHEHTVSYYKQKIYTILLMFFCLDCM